MTYDQIRRVKKIMEEDNLSLDGINDILQTIETYWDDFEKIHSSFNEDIVGVANRLGSSKGTLENIIKDLEQWERYKLLTNKLSKD